MLAASTPWHDPATWETTDFYGAHVPAAACRFERTLCGDNHTAEEVAAPWLVDNYTNVGYEHGARCFAGPDGVSNFFDASFNATQPCILI